MFASTTTPEIDITEFHPEKAETSDQSETEEEPEFTFEKLEIEDALMPEPQKPVAFDDLLNHVQSGLTIVVCSSAEFMVKNTVKGKHLDMLAAGIDDKKVVLVCVDGEQPPLDFVPELKKAIGLGAHVSTYVYYGSDDTSKIFALRLSSSSVKCLFSLPEPHFTTSLFPFF